MEDWSEISVCVPVEQCDTAAAIAQMAVPYGIYIEDYSDLTTEAPKIAHIDLIDEDLLAKDRSHAWIHLYIKPTENPAEAVSFLGERLDAAQIPYRIDTVKVKEEDWATAWKQYYHPVKVGQRLVVCPSWEEYKAAQDEVVLCLDPGMAFGTGTHDTTRLCMQFLEEYVTPGCQVLDVGCGSGILSIAAMLLGGQSALGVDIDETAVRVARENAQMNQVADRTSFVCGDLTQKVDGQYDIVCANIVADVILRLAPSLRPFLKPQGVFLASGIIEERAQEVIQALEDIGLTLLKRKDSGGWVALSFAMA